MDSKQVIAKAVECFTTLQCGTEQEARDRRIAEAKAQAAEKEFQMSMTSYQRKDRQHMLSVQSGAIIEVSQLAEYIEDLENSDDRFAEFVPRGHKGVFVSALLNALREEYKRGDAKSQGVQYRNMFVVTDQPEVVGDFDADGRRLSDDLYTVHHLARRMNPKGKEEAADTLVAAIDIAAQGDVNKALAFIDQAKVRANEYNWHYIRGVEAASWHDLLREWHKLQKRVVQSTAQQAQLASRTDVRNNYVHIQKS